MRFGDLLPLHGLIRRISNQAIQPTAGRRTALAFDDEHTSIASDARPHQRSLILCLVNANAPIYDKTNALFEHRRLHRIRSPGSTTDLGTYQTSYQASRSRSDGVHQLSNPSVQVRQAIHILRRVQKACRHLPAGQRGAAVSTELLPYRGEKGNLKFPLSKPMPYPLIKRVASALARAKQRKA